MYNLDNFMRTHSPRNGEFFTIAIDGRGGSGKTSLAEYLEAQMPGILMLHGDDYFEPVNAPVVWGEFNDNRFKRDVILPLQQGTEFTYRPYDWDTEPHITNSSVTVDKAFCLERCYSFAFELEWDLRIWVETPANICFERGIVRDNGLDEHTVRKAWKIWQEREDEYIANTKPQQLASWSINGTVPFTDQFAARS